MKYIITESQHQTVLLETISTYLRRRMYMDVMKDEMDDIIENHLDPCDFKDAGDFVAEACDVMTYGYLEDLNASAKDTDSFYYHMVDLFGDYLVKVYNKNCGNKNMVTESKLNRAIYEYIDNLFKEGKKIEMVKHTHEDDDTLDNREVEGAYDFFHKGEDDLFTWTGKEYYERPYNTSVWSKWLELAPVVEIVDYGKLDVLNAMFDNLWRPVFIQWFEDTFSLPVKTLN